MTDYCENGKPKDCRYCYYYGRHGCMLKVCYYDRPKPETKPVSECDDCPYGKCGPCIGWCTKEILRSLERGRAVAAGRCRTDFADIQNKKECGGNRQWQRQFLRKWAANTKGKAII